MTQPPPMSEMTLKPIIAQAALARLSNTDISGLLENMFADAAGANLFMNQFQLFSVLGNKDFAFEMQARALELSTVYRIAGAGKPAIRLLALVVPGDSSDNTPLDYLVEGTDIQLELLYLVSGHGLPAFIPEHDVAMIAMGESVRNREALERADALIACWPRPVLNQAKYILHCSREGVYLRLKDIPGLLIPPTLRAERNVLEKAVRLPDDRVSGLSYPITVRPLDSQAGRGFSRIDSARELRAYLDASNEAEFFVSLFVDYRSADGLYRKARIVLIDGQPYICHLAISDNWIVHYGSADMLSSAEKRRDEAGFMRDFDADFARRHRAALSAIAARLKLDYVVIDCAETMDGKLLVFEADNRGWVHATDPVDIFPYKQEPMRRVFTAFRAMLLKAMQGG